jgi:hypothetical protein
MNRFFLDAVARVLKPSGYFIGQSISGDHYVTWIRRAFGLLPHPLNQLIVKKLYGRDSTRFQQSIVSIDNSKLIAQSRVPA